MKTMLAILTSCCVLLTFGQSFAAKEEQDPKGGIGGTGVSQDRILYKEDVIDRPDEIEAPVTVERPEIEAIDTDISSDTVADAPEVESSDQH